jgi:hypothetical protein
VDFFFCSMFYHLLLSYVLKLPLIWPVGILSCRLLYPSDIVANVWI